MVYTPPTKAQLRAMVSRDLRDADNSVFGAAEVDDLANFGISEVSRVYPVPLIEDVAIVDDGDDLPLRQYTIKAREVYRVELYKEGARWRIEEGYYEAGSGWELFGDQLIIPGFVPLDDEDGSVFKVWGYEPRETLQEDTDVAEFDADAEMGVRLYASLTGYQRLQNDRAQFQQWLAIPGNNDISATQLDGLANTYLAQWNRHRNHMRTLRR